MTPSPLEVMLCIVLMGQLEYIQHEVWDVENSVVRVASEWWEGGCDTPKTCWQTSCPAALSLLSKQGSFSYSWFIWGNFMRKIYTIFSFLPKPGSSQSPGLCCGQWGLEWHRQRQNSCTELTGQEYNRKVQRASRTTFQWVYNAKKLSEILKKWYILCWHKQEWLRRKMEKAWNPVSFLTWRTFPHEPCLSKLSGREPKGMCIKSVVSCH